MNFDDTALEDIITVKFIQHLRLGRMNDIAEIHMVFECAFKGHFDRLRDWHCRFTCCERKGNRARVCAKGNALGHSCMRIATYNYSPVINCQIIQDFMDNVRHGVIFALWITRCNQTKFIHKVHELWNISL